MSDRARRPLVEPSAHVVEPLAARLRAASNPRAATSPLLAGHHGDRGTPAVIGAGPATVTPLFGAPEPAPAAAHAVGRSPTMPPGEIERRLAEVRAELEQEGQARMRAELDAIERRLLGGLDRLDRAASVTARPSAAEVVELALIAATEMVGHVVRVDRDRLVDVIDRALDEVEGERGGATVRLAAEDLAFIRARHPGRFPALRLLEDPRLQPGGCVVETSRRIVDASIEARMDAVRRAIREALAGEPAPAAAPPAAVSPPEGSEP